MDKQRLKIIIEEYEKAYEKHNKQIQDSKNISEMCSNYARYCGHLEALLMSIEIESGVLRNE